LNHDEFPDILCRYQTDQLLVALNREHGTLTIFKPRKGGFQHIRRIDNLKLALHNITDKCLLPILGQSHKQPPSG